MKKLSLLKFFSLTATALLTVGAGFCLSGCEEQVDETAEYTVTYLGIEGASNENIATYTAADGVIILNAPSKEWYDFKGWYKSEDAEEQITQIEAKTDKDITLYARWEPSAYQAEYYANGTLVHTQTFTYLQQTWIDPSVPEINGYSGVWEEYTVRPGNFVVLAEYSLRE